ncbi:MAG TPA: sugar phosphate nucleotidyltransferase [Terriglobales bacterium]|nr:sugar phosphate nucleotidyltransferase [Terriglobales bacterium]
MKALVLTGGSGRNLVPFSATRPKSMCVVAGGSLLKRMLGHLRQAGVTDAIIVLGPNGSRISEAFGSGEDLGIKLTYVTQREPGIANAIRAARERFNPGEYLILAYGDVVTSENPFFQLLQSFNAFKGPVATVGLPGPPTGRYGNVYLSGTRITRIVEKPTSSNLGNYVLAGIFILPSEVFTHVDRAEGDMVRVFNRLLETTGIDASLWEQGWIDVESPWDILAANRMVMDTWDQAHIASAATIEGNVALHGPVRIEAGAVIKSGAVLVGPCYIGRDCYVGNNSLLRNYTSLGARSIVGYGVELKNCVLFGNSDVGRLSFVGDSVIGESVDLGSGTVTINENLDHSPITVEIRGEAIETELVKIGSFIGDEVKIGVGNKLAAGAVIPAGTIIPHDATVGAKRS